MSYYHSRFDYFIFLDSFPEDSMSHAVPPPSPPFPMKSAFSPLVPPGVFPSAASRYALFQQQQQQQHTKRFLAAPYSGTGYLSTIIQSENDQMEANGNGDRCGSAGESQEWYEKL